MNIIKHIPNTLTCCNLLSGCLSIVYLSNGNFFMASVMIFVAALFDFFDGFMARLLKAFSPLGADLDSLSDCVSFGVAPAFIMFGLLRRFDCLLIAQHHYVAYIAFLLAACSALRLAKFNIDERQTTSFIGLPTPAMAVFVATLTMALCNSQDSDLFVTLTFNPYFLIGSVVVFSFLMVSEIPFFSLKLKSLAFRGNERLYITAILGIISIIGLGWQGLPLIMMIYVVSNLIRKSYCCNCK